MDLTPTEAPLWSEDVRIRSYDVDASRRATSLSLFRYFLEAAWNHAETLGVGYNFLRDQGKFWVLSRLCFEAQHYPEWGARSILKTWPRGISSVFALRDFEFNDETGSRSAAGSSSWLVVDSVSKRPQRLHRIMPMFAALGGKAALGRDPEKLEENHTWDSESTVIVHYTDIDVNRHVNSARYIGWILDSYPTGHHLQHSLAMLEINYLNEALEGEQLTVRTHEIAKRAYLHSLIKPNGPEVCRARLEWKSN